MLRILMLTFEYGRIKLGGLATMVSALCKELDKTRFRPVVVLPRSGYEVPWEPRERISLPSCDAVIYDTPDAEIWLLENEILNGNGIYPERYIKKFDEYSECITESLSQFRADVIHLHDMFGYKCLFVANEQKIPTVFTMHRLHYDELHSCFPEMALVRLADVVTTVSRSYLEENPQYFGVREDAVAVPNGLDFEGWEFPAGEDVLEGRAARRKHLLHSLELPDRVTFLYFGRLDGDQKGVEVLLDAVKQPVGDMNLLIVGNGTESLEQQVAALAAERNDHIRYLPGMKDVEAVRNLMSAVDFVVMPSKYEPFGLVQLEAMVMGALPIASRTGGFRDVIIDIDDGGFGKLVPKGDAPALAAAMKAMAALRELDELRRAARARAHTFSARRMAGDYEAIYERLTRCSDLRA